MIVWGLEKYRKYMYAESIGIKTGSFLHPDACIFRIGYDGLLNITEVQNL